MTYFPKPPTLAAAFVLAALTLPPGAAFAQRVGVTDQQVNGADVGMSYQEARARLLEFGYGGAAASRDPGRCGSRKAVCKAYPEAEGCAGTGEAPCRFVFKYPRGRKLVVVTGGESLTVTRIFEEK